MKWIQSLSYGLVHPYGGIKLYGHFWLSVAINGREEE